jgi:hypothetical protein
VPLTFAVDVIDVLVPEQIDRDAGVAVMVGTGFTVTVPVIFDPTQVLAVGVIVYTAVPAVVAVAVSVCAITVPEPLEAPVTLVCVAVHE